MPENTNFCENEIVAQQAEKISFTLLFQPRIAMLISDRNGIKRQSNMASVTIGVSDICNYSPMGNALLGTKF